MGNDAGRGGRGRTWLAPRRQNVALRPRSAPPSRRCEASSARPSPEAGRRTTCCCLGALRPSPRKFTPGHASPGRLGYPLEPKLPGTAGARHCPGAGPSSCLGPWGPLSSQPGPRLAAGGLPGYPALPTARGPRAGGGQERAPRRAGGGGNPASRLS